MVRGPGVGCSKNGCEGGDIGIASGSKCCCDTDLCNPATRVTVSIGLGLLVPLVLGAVQHLY